MATITYSTSLPDTLTRTTVSVKINPVADGEEIFIELGFHPSAMSGLIIKDLDETALLFWEPGLLNFVGYVGSDFEASPVVISRVVQNAIRLTGPGPLIGDGVSKERIPMGVTIENDIVRIGNDMFLTFTR